MSSLKEDESTCRLILRCFHGCHEVWKSECLVCCYNIGGDIEKLGGESLALCDNLKEGDFDRNARHLRYKIEKLSESAIEQIKEKTKANELLVEANDRLLADLKRYQEKPILPQLGSGEGIKTELSQLSKREFDTSTQGTTVNYLLTTSWQCGRNHLSELLSHIPSGFTDTPAKLAIGTLSSTIMVLNQPMSTHLAGMSPYSAGGYMIVCSQHVCL